MADAFVQFKRSVLGKADLSKVALDVIESAFYAGALTFNNSLVSSNGESAEDLSNELNTFAVNKIEELTTRINSKNKQQLDRN